MADRVVLHVGTPKSGTTFVQTILWRNRDALHAQGVLLPGRTMFDGNRAAVAVRGRHRPNPRTGTPAATWQAMQADIAEWPGTAVVSNEWFSLAPAERVEQTVRSLGPERVHVVVTARPFVPLVPAAWQETLKLGNASSLTDFVPALDDTDEAQRWTWLRLDPAEVLARWGDLLPPEHVHVVTVPPGADRSLLWQRFATASGVDPDWCDTSVAVPNESLGAESARLLQRIGPDLRAGVDADDAHWSEPYRWIRRYVAHEVLVPRGGSRIVLRADEVQQVLRRGRASVEAMRTRGYDVVGDLDDLLAEDQPAGGKHPDDVTTDEVLEAAGALAGKLLGRVRHQAARPGRAGKPWDDAAGAAPEEEAHVTEPTRPANPGDDPGKDRAQVPARVLARGFEQGTRLVRTLRRTDPTPSKQYVGFLLYRLDGSGGVARTVINLANWLADTHDVELIGLYRRQDEMSFDIDPRITVTHLYDARLPPTVRKHRGLYLPRHHPKRNSVASWLDRLPSRVAPDERETEMSRWTDHILRDKLQSLPAGVLISTRPSLHLAASRLAPRRVITVAQEHLNFENRSAGALGFESYREAYRNLDCVAVLTQADARDYANLLGDEGAHVTAIPNAVPWSGQADPSSLDAKIVIAGGRLTRQKGFDRLLEAYVPIAEAYPDWELHIYGRGQLLRDLRQQAIRLGIADKALLKGHTDDFRGKLHGAGVYAMTSRYEGFPMVLVEAMSQGLPMVSMDCPRGPAEIIRDGENGRLVGDGDVKAFSEALLDVLGDDAARRRMGAESAGGAGQFDIDVVGKRWEALFDQLLERRRSAGAGDGAGASSSRVDRG